MPWDECLLLSDVQIPPNFPNLCSKYRHRKRPGWTSISTVKETPYEPGTHKRSCCQPYRNDFCHTPVHCVCRCAGKDIIDLLGHYLIWSLYFQLRFSLSNASAWNEEDGCFSYVLFYNNIVDFFELTPGPASKKRSSELLNWWSRYIPIRLI